MIYKKPDLWWNLLTFIHLLAVTWLFAFPRRLMAWLLRESTCPVELPELQHSLCSWPTTPTKPHLHLHAFSSFCRPVVSSTAALFSVPPVNRRPALRCVLCPLCKSCQNVCYSVLLKFLQRSRREGWEAERGDLKRSFCDNGSEILNSVACMAELLTPDSNCVSFSKTFLFFFWLVFNSKMQF